MKVNITQPNKIKFTDLKAGKLFQYDCGVYIKTSNTEAVVIHKVAGLMGEEGKAVKFSEHFVKQIIEATFVVGNPPK